MKSYVHHLLIAMIVIGAVPLGLVLAHGEPEIVVEPTIVAAGGTITVKGTEMENGEKFVITLQGAQGSIPLGEATAAGEPDASFVVTFTIPETIVPSSYTVRAATEDGGIATADLTVTAPTTKASAGPATVPAMATADSHILDRTKPAVEIVVVLVVIALSGISGFTLVRRQPQIEIKKHLDNG